MSKGTANGSSDCGDPRESDGDGRCVARAVPNVKVVMVMVMVMVMVKEGREWW